MIVILDQIGKYWALQNIKEFEKKSICYNQISLNLQYNRGAMLGFLRNRMKSLKMINIAAVTILFITLFHILFVKGYTYAKVGLSFMIGGAIGNIIDRIKKGFVVDFFSFRFLPGVVFNIADLFIISGGVIVSMGLFISSLKK